MAIINDDELRKYAEQKAEKFYQKLIYLAGEIGKSAEECISVLSKEGMIIKASAKHEVRTPVVLGAAFLFHEAATIAIQQSQFDVFVDNLIDISQGLTMAEMLIDDSQLKREYARKALGNNPKQQEKLLVKKEWVNWQANPNEYKNKTAFAADMLKNYPLLKSEKVITDWCRQWEK